MEEFCKKCEDRLKCQRVCKRLSKHLLKTCKYPFTEQATYKNGKPTVILKDRRNKHEISLTEGIERTATEEQSLNSLLAEKAARDDWAVSILKGIQLTGAWLSLSKKQRTRIKRHHLSEEKKSIKEIADKDKVSSPSVKESIESGINTLKKRLGHINPKSLIDKGKERKIP